MLVELHTRHFDAMGPYFKHASAAIPVVVDKLFNLLLSLPVTKVSDSLPVNVRLACARGLPVPCHVSSLQNEQFIPGME